MPESAAPRRLGILGGSFDPIHIGHLVAAEEARVALGLATVLFVPTGQPYHRTESPAAAADDRFRMTELAIRSNPAFAASRLEIERPGPSYTIDTVRALQAERPGAELYLILGTDAVAQLFTWHEHEALVRECRFIVVSRPGVSRDEAVAGGPPGFERRLHYLEIPNLDVSSTELRRRLREGRSVRYLVPAEVEHYIRERGLYR